MQVILFTDVSETPGYGKYAGTYKIATEIRNHGYTCQVIDLFTWYDDNNVSLILNKFVTSDTLLVGFSATFLEKRNTPGGQYFNPTTRWVFGRPLSQMEEIWASIRTLSPKCKIVVGGSQVNSNTGWAGVDYAIFNKADLAIKKLLDHISGSSDIKITNQVNGTKIINGEDYFYSQTQFASSVLKFTHDDIIFSKESLPLEVARGCIFSCAFCRFDLIGKRVGDWQRSSDSLYNEIMYNYENFGTTHAMISDELINESLEKLELLTDIFSRLPFKFSYSGYARVDLIWRYPEMIDLLLASGANGLIFGIETLNDSVGKKIGKGLGSDKIKETLVSCKEKWKDNILIRGNFIVGLPGESQQSIWNTVDYLLSDQNPLDMWDFMPLNIIDTNQGKITSKIDRDPKKYGYIKLNQNWQNNEMSRADAESIALQIYKSQAYRQKNKLSQLSWMGRMHNLDYSLQDILDIKTNHNYTKDMWIQDLAQREDQKKQQYLHKLLEI